MKSCLHAGYPQLSKKHRPPHRSIKQMRQKKREYPTLPSFGLRRHKAHKHKLFGGCINFYANTASFARMMIAYWHSLRKSLNMFIYNRHPLQANFRSIHGYRFSPRTHRLSATQGHFWAKSGLWGEKKPVSTWLKVCFPHRCPMSFIARGSFNQTHLPVLKMAT